MSVDGEGNLSTNGLVLAERTVGDWDKSLTLLLEGVGLLSVWARGAKHIKGPLLAASSLFCYGHYTLRQRGDRVTVVSAEVRESFFALRADLARLALAGYLVEFCRALCAEQQPEDPLLRLTLNALHATAYATAPLPVVKAGYELRALAETGFAPMLTRCVRCGASDGIAAFSVRDGGLLCTACAEKPPIPLPVSPAIQRALLHLCHANASRLYAFRLPPQQMAELSAICETYALFSIGHDLKSLTFYNGLPVPS